jgi:hypothetical protein
MLRIESWLHDKTAAIVEPNLYRWIMRRRWLPTLRSRSYPHLQKVRRFGFPQPLLPLVKLPRSQTTSPAKPGYALTTLLLFGN